MKHLSKQMKAKFEVEALESWLFEIGRFIGLFRHKGTLYDFRKYRGIKVKNYIREGWKMNRDQKAIYKFAQEVGRDMLRNNVARRTIRRKIAAKRISAKQQAIKLTKVLIDEVYNSVD